MRRVSCFAVLFFGLLVYTADLQAFEIRGRVVDFGKQNGLEGVTVKFVALDGRPFDQVITDQRGEFRKDVPSGHQQFRIAYEKGTGGPDGLGYEGYGRTFPVDNNVQLKDVDTVALRPRRKEASAVPSKEKDVIVKDWLSHYLVTKEQTGVSQAVKYYAIDQQTFTRSAHQLERETGRSDMGLTWKDVKPIM